MFHPSGVRTWDRNYNEKKKEMKRVVLFTINHPRVKKIKEFFTFCIKPQKYVRFGPSRDPPDSEDPWDICNISRYSNGF
jgi:hypothetical protein